MIPETVKSLSKEYKSALKDFLGGGGEAALKNAYMLGREALEEQASVLDIVIAHHQALATLVEDSAEDRKTIKRAADFLAECLSPFEMAQRGFQESIAALNSLNARLEDEVANRTQALRESEELYRTLIEVSPDAIAMTDLEGKVTVCNKQYALMYGFPSVEDVIGTNAGDFIAPEDMPMTREVALNVLNEGAIGKMEYTLIRKDGARLPVEVRVTLVKDADGKPSGFIGVNRDITERKQAQLKLEALFKIEAEARKKAEEDNELKLKALAIVSHELRTPLTSIKGFADTLLAEDVVWDASSQRDFIVTIHEEAQKLGELIEQLLDLSKMDAGVFKLSLARHRPEDLIEAAASHLHILIGGHHNLTITVPAGLPDVFADAQRVGQVLENLVENAAKYAPSGTAVRVSARVSGGFLEISVADEGPGIPKQDREKVFQAFYRADEKTTINIKGAGLGLTICRRLIEAHGGRIWVEGQSGPGTVISFTLPLLDAIKK
ncbi:MAG TPA: ATP-binding protein [Anaerolineales bacterium]|nr:ATP-binding protein [Anaerolineales bacterium]